MALTILKTAVQAQAPPQVKVVHTAEVGTDIVQTQVDELLALQRDYLDYEMDKTTKRIAELKKSLQSVANEYGNPESAFSIVSASGKGVVVFSKPSNSLEITEPVTLIENLGEKFGADAVKQCVTIKITEVRDFLSENELKAYSVEKKGSRTCKVNPANPAN